MTPVNYHSDKFEELRKQAKELINRQPEITDDVPLNVMELINELKIHQIELELQNKELQQTQNDLSELYIEYENLYEFAPCGYITLTSSGVANRVNLTVVSLLGVEKTSILGLNFTHYIQDKWRDLFQEAKRESGQTGDIKSIEIMLKSKTRASIWVNVDS